MDHSARVYDDIIEMLPNEENPSPMVRLRRLVPDNGSELWAKLEWLNPFGSVKDRAAWAMVKDLEEKGELGPTHPGRGLVEPTSGIPASAWPRWLPCAATPCGGGALQGAGGEEGAAQGVRARTWTW